MTADDRAIGRLRFGHLSPFRGLMIPNAWKGEPMGREMLARDLEQAENHVRHGASLLRNQKLILLELEADGHDTRRAHELLDTFQTLELEHIAHRDRLEEELDEAEKENGTRAGPMAKDVAKALGKSI